MPFIFFLILLPVYHTILHKHVYVCKAAIEPLFYIFHLLKVRVVSWLVQRISGIVSSYEYFVCPWLPISLLSYETLFQTQFYLFFLIPSGSISFNLVVTLLPGSLIIFKFIEILRLNYFNTKFVVPKFRVFLFLWESFSQSLW